MHNINIWGVRSLYFQIEIDELPKLAKVYQVERKTVWSTIEPENLLIVVTNGEGYFEINNKEYLVKKNQVIFIPAGQEYKRRPKDNLPATYFYIHFKCKSTPQEFTSEEAVAFVNDSKEQISKAVLSGISMRFSTPHHLLLNRITVFNDEIITITDKMINQSLLQHIESSFLTSVYFYEILGLAMKYAVENTMKTIDTPSFKHVSRKIQKAVFYVNQNYKKSISVSELCDICGITPQHLIRLFKEHLGTTPTQYINRVKINYAKNLIQNQSHLSMKEIAFELGFENPNYFSRLFFKLEGENPSDFKIRVAIPNDVYQSGTATVKAKSQRSKK